ncbi:E3 binding domain-containing protein, partial [Streptomyces sp. DT225]
MGYGTGAPPVRRRRVRPEGLKAAVAVPVASVEVVAPVPEPAPGPVAVVSPLVRRLARQHGLDLR